MKKMIAVEIDSCEVRDALMRGESRAPIYLRAVADAGDKPPQVAADQLPEPTEFFIERQFTAQQARVLVTDYVRERAQIKEGGSAAVEFIFGVKGLQGARVKFSMV